MLKKYGLNKKQQQNLIAKKILKGKNDDSEDDYNYSEDSDNDSSDNDSKKDSYNGKKDENI